MILMMAHSTLISISSAHYETEIAPSYEDTQPNYGLGLSTTG
jgi:hypothetical protein